MSTMDGSGRTSETGGYCPNPSGLALIAGAAAEASPDVHPASRRTSTRLPSPPRARTARPPARAGPAEIIRTDGLTKMPSRTGGSGAGGHGRRPPRPVGPGRGDLRAPRAQRRRQDDHRRHAHHPGRADLGSGAGRRRRRRGRPGPGQAGHRGRAPVEHPRPRAHRLAEPLLPRALLRDGRRRGAGGGGPAAGAVPPGRPGEGQRGHAVGRHGPAAHGGPGDHAPAPHPRSSTSRPPASTPRAASPCGRSSPSSTPPARPSSSPRTTWRRPTSSATGWRSWTTAGSWPSTRRPGSSGRSAPTRSSGSAARPAMIPASLRRLAAVLAVMEGARSAHVTEGGVLLYLSGPVARTLPRIFAAAEANGFPVTDLSVTEPTLEAVFITLTGQGAPGLTVASAPARGPGPPLRLASCGLGRPPSGPSGPPRRDLAVLRKELPIFVVRTIMQPLLLLFVFTYVFPRIGQAVGGTGAAAADFSTMLVAGRRGHRHDLPGHPGRRPAPRPGVRLHPGDRGPGPRPAAGVGRGGGEDRLRRPPGADRRGHRLPAGGPPAGQRRPPRGRLARPADRGAAGRPHRSVARDWRWAPGSSPTRCR